MATLALARALRQQPIAIADSQSVETAGRPEKPQFAIVDPPGRAANSSFERAPLRQR
jgi:hypothetical protein